MKMPIPVFLSLAACLAPLALAQTIANPITSMVKSVMAKSELNMIASAQAS
jgi:hypothetical protein